MSEADAVLRQIIAAAPEADNPIVTAALCASFTAIGDLARELKEDRKGFLYTIAALAGANGDVLKVSKLDLANVNPNDSVERYTDIKTGDLIYRLVRAK